MKTQGLSEIALVAEWRQGACLLAQWPVAVGAGKLLKASEVACLFCAGVTFSSYYHSCHSL